VEVNRQKSLRLLSVAYYLKHGISKSGLKDFLLAMDIASPTNSLPKEMKSPYTLLKRFDHLKKDIERIYVCRSCPKILKNGPDGLPSKQQPCGHPYDRVQKHCYTLLLDIEFQLKYFLQHYGIRKKVYSTGVIGDVTSGNSYQESMNELGQDSEKTITLQINLDGAQMFESSKWNFWPFMLIINEAPYHIRRENVVLLGIHHCEGKPVDYAFVDPCVHRLKMLEETGIEFNGDHHSIRVLIITADTIARPVVKNTTQFNGRFGCDFCLHPGYFISYIINMNITIYLLVYF